MHRADRRSKVCSKCDMELNIDLFSFRNKSKNIRQSICKRCINKYNKTYRKNNKNTITLCKKKYYADNRQTIIDKNKEYYKDNSDRFKQKRLERYYKNKSKERAYMRKYNNKRIKMDPLYKLKITIKKRIRSAIKNNHYITNENWRDLLGCSVIIAKLHIEHQFYKHPITQTEMTWDNHGEWEIDHIIPVSSITSLDDANQIRKVFHYSNLQPLWKEENSNKRAKLSWDREQYWGIQ